MIISASRRTDIPAFYTPWFINRIRAGHCRVPNPFNPNQIASVSLRPDDVDVIVFWTRHGLPMLPHLEELDQRGYHYYFLYTVMNNPRSLDPKSPDLDAAVRSFCSLAEQIGPDKVVWRYDPILFSTMTDRGFHLETYDHIAQRLKGHTNRSIISFATIYRKSKKKLEALATKGLGLLHPSEESMVDFTGALARMARENGMEITSCAQAVDLTPYGVLPGKCVDDDYISNVFGLNVTGKKDPSQRKACGCVVSKDIGMYDTCLFDCAYCYATGNSDRARMNHDKHDPQGLSLLS